MKDSIGLLILGGVMTIAMQTSNNPASAVIFGALGMVAFVWSMFMFVKEG